MVILVDHIEMVCGSRVLSWVTLHQFGLSDGLDAFVFISGYVFALVHGRIQEQRGFGASLAKAFKRSGILWLSNCLAFAVVLCMGFAVPSNVSALAILRLDHAVAAPGEAFGEIAVMYYQPFGFDILPLYIVLLWMAPFLLYIGRKRQWLLALVSLFLVASLFAIPQLMLQAQGCPWLFQPLGWQLVFSLGMLANLCKLGGVIEKRRSAWACASFCVLVIITLSSNGIRGSYLPGSLNIWHNQQWIPGLLRVSHFVALAIFAATLSKAIPDLFSGNSVSRTLCATGKHALPIFVWGLLVTYAAALFGEPRSVPDTILFEIFGITTTALIAHLFNARHETKLDASHG